MKRNKKRSLYTYKQDHSDLINFLKQFDNENKKQRPIYKQHDRSNIN